MGGVRNQGYIYQQKRNMNMHRMPHMPHKHRRTNTDSDIQTHVCVTMMTIAITTTTMMTTTTQRSRQLSRRRSRHPSHTHLHTCTHAHAHVHTHTYTHTHAHTHEHTLEGTLTRTHAQSIHAAASNRVSHLPPAIPGPPPPVCVTAQERPLVHVEAMAPSVQGATSQEFGVLMLSVPGLTHAQTPTPRSCNRASSDHSWFSWHEDRISRSSQSPPV